MSLNKDLKDKMIARDGNLHVYWYLRDWFGKKVKTFTVVCNCGNNKLLVVERGLRCTECSGFHSHDSFMQAREKARKARSWDDGKIEKIPQPMLDMWEVQKRRRKSILDRIRPLRPKIITSYKQ